MSIQDVYASGSVSILVFMNEFYESTQLMFDAHAYPSSAWAGAVAYQLVTVNGKNIYNSFMAKAVSSAH